MSLTSTNDMPAPDYSLDVMLWHHARLVEIVPTRPGPRIRARHVRGDVAGLWYEIEAGAVRDETGRIVELAARREFRPWASIDHVTILEGHGPDSSDLF